LIFNPKTQNGDKEQNQRLTEENRKNEDQSKSAKFNVHYHNELASTKPWISDAVRTRV
jgi:hypothetical protein